MGGDVAEDVKETNAIKETHAIIIITRPSQIDPKPQLSLSLSLSLYIYIYIYISLSIYIETFAPFQPPRLIPSVAFKINENKQKPIHNQKQLIS